MAFRNLVQAELNMNETFQLGKNGLLEYTDAGVRSEQHNVTTENSQIIVNLKCSYGHDHEMVYQLTISECKLSSMIHDAIPEDMEEGEDERNRTRTIDIEIPYEKSACLGKVVEFLKHYQLEEMQAATLPLLDSNTFNEVVSQKWYQDFVSDTNMSRTEFYQVTKSADFLGIQPLLDLTIMKFTFLLNGKPADEVHEIIREFDATQTCPIRTGWNHKKALQLEALASAKPMGP